DLPGIEAIATDIRTPVPTTIWSQDGVLLGQLEVENRQPLSLKQVESLKNVNDATIAIEDHRFYEHGGVDAIGILRSAWADVQKKNTVQGGSTITQELIRNLPQFNLTKRKLYTRKVREILTAIRVDQLYTKPEILQLYLNNIYYGAGAYGIQAAAETYFGKPASKLDIAEAALLAGIPQRPSVYMPYDHRRACLQRRNEVLDRMLDYGYITPEAHRHALAERPRLIARRIHNNFDFKAPYFTTYVLRDLMRRYGSDFVYRGGLKIETTLDWKMQQMAERALKNGIENASRFGANQGALVCLDNHTGYIRAMVGGRDFRADQFNAVTQGARQPGSSFKVFDYSAAFDTGEANLYSTFRDVPIPYPHDPKGRVVKNYEGDYTYSPKACIDAIAHSINTIAVQVAARVGIGTVIEYAHKMGVTTPLAPYLPTALGASAVRPLDMCSVYSIFPMNGSRCLPMALVRVSDQDGNLLEEHEPQIQTNILKPDTVAQMDKAFEAVCEWGTGNRARGNEANGIVDNAHGKTGTTSDNRDCWFDGYTPELTTVVWMASAHRPKKGGPPIYVTMPGATGGVLCGPVWHDFMLSAVPEQRKFGPGPPPIAYAPSIAPQADGKTARAQARQRPPRDEETFQDGAQNTTDAAPDLNGETSQPSTVPVDTASADSPPGSPAGPNLPAAPLPNASSPPGAQAATLATPPAASSPPPAPAADRRSRFLTARAPAPPPGEKMVEVTICVDSRKRATMWCPVQEIIKVPESKAARMGYCRLHRPKPGEG
ncbi:MAG TPA: transglycosylase domain-containing protein, partial [Chthonomonadaceae bacterium]|nr:transglycosylase domain-containing protein [Chthonomonadaceae bacterium]